MANITNIGSASAFCCSILSLLLPDKITFPGNETYAASLTSYYSAQENSVSPACIASPQSAEDVSKIVHTLTTAVNTNASNSCPFAIRSGGHTSYAGSANVQDGVTIDMRGVDGVQLNSDKSVVSVGAGASWGSVYEYLDPYNLSVAGARDSTVGVGGLITGGGISYFGPRYGWACDKVLNYVVVLANGSIVNANKYENPGLLWALRGGSNNFGIVVRVDLQTFAQGEIWGGVVFYDFSTMDEQIEAIAAFSRNDTYDEFSSLVPSFGYFNGSSFIVNSLEYTKPVVNPPAFQKLMSIPSLGNTMRLTNISNLVGEAESLQMNGLRSASAAVTIDSSVEALRATVGAWNASVSSVKDITGIVWALAMDPLPPAMYSQHAATNALGLTSREGKSLIIVNLRVTWINADDDARVDGEMKQLIATMEREVGYIGSLDPFVYLNYAAPWQKPISSYGQTSMQRLTRIRQEYDPRRVFTNIVSGGFKIWN
ncbi:hypothetical protein TMatcc_002060 [Talaromyces marneffei ATCC 18224]|uniref:Oxidoreductase, FAD-binding, putative n=2 Tax=Talaromyces marneffei TaxID=37727 RepID=B6QIK8_TALMQ|nr:uncharacterized protein EYB26_006761 [Talaromyces marneffei]EEA23203.1 oxidoreductase, FAD-binding, putative [Talaromyces marneffei ATCC 18224]KAE8552053.1 hypothetical protein EYB25_005944 [Talaromyces marneffei]QGA19073.1 hypothetical protein EYB26_006761 [Talaromyces marneffei]